MKIGSLISLFLLFSIIVVGQIKNNGFENWHTISNIPNAEDPDFWTSTNIMPSNTGFNLGITKSTDAYEGNYAVKITPKRFQPSYFWNVTAGSILTYGISNPTALLHDNGFYIKDTITFIPSKLTGYYKRIKTNYVSTDTAYIIVLFSKKGPFIPSLYGYGDLGFTPTDIYQYFEVDIWADPAVDSIGISIFYESDDTSSTNGGYLLLDDLGLAPLVGTDNLEDVSIKVYPNPSSDYLYIEQGKNKRIDRIEIVDLQGRLMKSVEDIEESQERIDVRALERGYYIMRITSEHGVGVKKILIE